MTRIMVTNFYLIPEGSTTTRKRNKFLAHKYGAMVLKGEIADRVAEAAKVKRDGVLAVKDVPLKALIQLRNECAGHNKKAYQTLDAIININFLPEEIEQCAL
ncbi:hypothetical protein [Vibrio phage vB_ValS_PJ32]|nr:hypothetical protein [Vibrio phage vB_ValS_PJ32]